jgi:TatA/E family protein of Tat protein translocase
MFGMGMPEILLILAIALIVIGPQKLPELAKSLGRAMNEFKRATNELKDTMDLDGDLKDVKKSFNDIQTNLKKKPIDLVTDGLSSGDGDKEDRLQPKTDDSAAETQSAPDARTAEAGDADDDDGLATDIPAELMSDDEPKPPARPVPPATAAPSGTAGTESPRDDDPETDSSPRNG